MLAPVTGQRATPAAGQRLCVCDCLSFQKAGGLGWVGLECVCFFYGRGRSVPVSVYLQVVLSSMKSFIFRLQKQSSGLSGN